MSSLSSVPWRLGSQTWFVRFVFDVGLEQRVPFWMSAVHIGAHFVTGPFNEQKVASVPSIGTEA
jgi:hypothetical protein